MIPSSVSFTGFDVSNPEDVLLDQTQNKHAFWPLEWTLIVEPNTSDLSEINLFQWFRANCCHRWDMDSDSTGRRVFAFEDDGEATLFKLRF